MMNWSKDALLAKAQLYIEFANNCDREDRQFGLWYAFSLELLARASLANIHPALLAAPDNANRNVVYAIGHGGSTHDYKSAPSSLVIKLCQQLLPDLTPDDVKNFLAIINTRNEELHTGGDAFGSYSAEKWVSSFYILCEKFCKALSVDPTSVFGESEWIFAQSVICEKQNDVRKRVESLIAFSKRAFEKLEPEEQNIKLEKAKAESITLAFRRHHRVECPSCKGVATVTGMLVGNSKTIEDDGEIIVKQSVAPGQLTCSSCNLKLSTFAELDSVGLSAFFTRSTSFTPEEYFGLVNEDEIDWDSKVQEYIDGRYEYNND